MWTAILTFLGGPLISGLVGAYKAKLDAGNTTDRIAADFAAKDLELQAKEREIGHQMAVLDSGSFWTSAPRAIVCWSLALYIAKVVVWDTMLGLGSTIALKGMMAEAFSTILVFWFGSRSLEKIARIFRPK
jgi:hypothetical protein